MKKDKISKESIIKQTDDIVASEIDGETVMMSIENGQYYGLDLIGSHIRELIKTPIKVSDLVDTLLEQYDVDSFFIVKLFSGLVFQGLSF